jgi:hypothetical protein
VSIVAVADPCPPVFTREDLARNVQLEIKLLVNSMRNLNEEEAQDQVFKRVAFHLCTACYASWIKDPTGSSSPGLPAIDEN